MDIVNFFSDHIVALDLVFPISLLVLNWPGRSSRYLCWSISFVHAVLFLVSVARERWQGSVEMPTDVGIGLVEGCCFHSQHGNLLQKFESGLTLLGK